MHKSITHMWSAALIILSEFISKEKFNFTCRVANVWVPQVGCIMVVHCVLIHQFLVGQRNFKYATSAHREKSVLEIAKL